MPENRVPQPEASLASVRMHNDVVSMIGNHLGPKALGRLASSCYRFSRFFKPELDSRALLQAVIDDDRKTVERLFTIRPDLLLYKPHFCSIQSQLTWQIFMPESALMMALKRNQVEMVKVIVAAIEAAVDNGTLNKGQLQNILGQWAAAEASLQVPIKKARTYNFQSLIDVIRQNDPSSKATEDALAAFRKTVLPDTPIALDDHYDIEQLLLAAHQAYAEKFNQFESWEQRNLFCVQVIGYLQSLLSPEVAKIFCESLFFVLEQGKNIGELASTLKLQDNHSFYRESHGSREGLGSQWAVGVCGAVRTYGWMVWRGAPGGGAGCVTKLCQAKTADIVRLKERLLRRLGSLQQSQSQTYNSCMIL